jgi:hypothetical protein
MFKCQRVWCLNVTGCDAEMSQGVMFECHRVWCLNVTGVMFKCHRVKKMCSHVGTRTRDTWLKHQRCPDKFIQSAFPSSSQIVTTGIFAPQHIHITNWTFIPDVQTKGIKYGTQNPLLTGHLFSWLSYPGRLHSDLLRSVPRYLFSLTLCY